MRKTLLPSLTAIFVFTALLGAGDPPPAKDPILEKYAAKIAATLPGVWTVRVVNGECPGIALERKVAVPMINIAPSGQAHLPGEPYPMGTPSFFLVIGPPASAADVAAMIKGNADCAKALEMLRLQMADMYPKHPVKPSGGYEEDYTAHDAEQRARLDAFVAVKKAMPSKYIPELFAEDASFLWIKGGFEVPADDSVKREMDEIQAKVEAMFSKKPLK